MRKIIDESLECGKRLAALQLIDKMDSNTSWTIFVIIVFLSDVGFLCYLLLGMLNYICTIPSFFVVQLRDSCIFFFFFFFLLIDWLASSHEQDYENCYPNLILSPPRSCWYPACVRGNAVFFFKKKINFLFTLDYFLCFILLFWYADVKNKF
jgi:hypothetical protein